MVAPENKDEMSQESLSPVNDSSLPTSSCSSDSQVENLGENGHEPLSPGVNQTNVMVHAEQHNTFNISREFPPEDCERYEVLHPGATKQIFDGIDREQVHRHEMNRVDIMQRGQYINLEFEFKGRGQIIGGIAIVVIAICEMLGVFFGKVHTPYMTYVAFALIVSVFITGQLRSVFGSEEDEESEDE